MLAAMMRLLFVLGFALTGCSSSSANAVDAAPSPDGAPQDGAPQDGAPPAGRMVLTSSAFSEGATIPTVNTCNGANTSPVLSWTGAPSGTQSFAVVLTDLTIAMAHWVIYDIPASATGLPAAIENTSDPASVPGAHQIVSIHAPTIGFYGPCPPVGQTAHSYQFAVYALDVATLPGVSAQSSRPDAVAAVQTHRLDSGTLTGMFGR